MSRSPVFLLRRMRCLLTALLLGMLAFSATGAPSVEVPDPERTDTCPVCGMFVALYPEWVATVVYRDGHAHHFDGAKDLFKYLLDMPRWAPGDKAEDITTIAVTDYYGVTRIDAREAWYVIGSDVLGPMGHELVPLTNEEEADEFMADHEGRRIVRFDEVTASMLEDLDVGRF